ncbi:MAG: sensor histidine kinase [Spirochaetaceae bacterium]|nr:MAG: sensor histidine kinase [Spirochaetaceae bacterium]
MELALAQKDQLLTRVLRLVSIAGVVPYLSGVWLAAAQGVWPVVIMNTVVYASVVAVSVVPSVAFRWKLMTVVAGTWMVGTVLLFTVGVLGAAYVWLAAAIIFAAIFGERRAVAAVVALTTTMLLAYTFAILHGLESYGATPETILVNGASLLVVSISTALLVSVLTSRLEEALRQEQSLTRELSAEVDAGQELLREVHHRVNNNMQLVLSMMHLESAERLPGRVRALAAINALLHRDRTSLTAELPDIVEAVRELLESMSACILVAGAADGSSATEGSGAADGNGAVPRLAAATAIPFGLYLYECGEALVERDISVRFEWSITDGADELRFSIVPIDGSGAPLQPQSHEVMQQVMQQAMSTVENSLAAQIIQDRVRFVAGQNLLSTLVIPLT